MFRSPLLILLAYALVKREYPVTTEAMDNRFGDRGAAAQHVDTRHGGEHFAEGAACGTFHGRLVQPLIGLSHMFIGPSTSHLELVQLVGVMLQTHIQDQIRS